MKLLVDILIGGVACCGAYYLALPSDPEATAVSPARRTAAASAEHRRAPSPLGRPRIGRLEAAGATAAGVDAERRRSLQALRNEVIRATSKDLRKRGVDVLQCLDEVRLAGPEKVRFAVDVESSPTAATTGRWRFVEVVDGEPLPDSFPACAARTLGGGHELVPPDSERFPDYRGDLEIIYTIPAPPAE